MTHIPDNLRRLVIERAGEHCEYCLIDQQNRWLGFEIDHIIAEKHRGQTAESNLCLSCFHCNHHKGSDFASFDPLTDEVAMLFNPRRDRWSDHFQLKGAVIEPLTPQGRVTVFRLQFNDAERVAYRADLISIGDYPPSQQQDESGELRE